MKIPQGEELAFQKLHSIAKQDKYIIKHVLMSILVMIELAAYKHEEEIIIPFLGKLHFDYCDRTTSKGLETVLNLQLAPSNILINEFSAITDELPTQAVKFYKREIIGRIVTILEKKGDLETKMIEYFNVMEKEYHELYEEENE